MKPEARYSPTELACALGLFPPTAEQAAVIAAPPGPLVVIAGAGAGKTETMAARVVWLVANGYAEPDQVLGLTFTRKAAGQLLRRVRSRLARLTGIGLGAGGRAGLEPASAPVVSTYHAFAGSLLRDYGLLLPVEPATRLLSETELWQLAFDVVSGYRGELRTDKNPAAVTSMVLRLWGQLAEHLVDTDQLRDTHGELERLVHALPAGPYQRDRGPSQWLLRLLAAQTERAELVPLLDALDARMRAAKVMDFGVQMAAAARLAAGFPHVGQDLRSRYRVVLLDEYQDTGHAQRVALSGLFGGGVDDGLALTAVGDPIQSIYGWRGASATNLPRFTTDFPRSDGTPAPVLELRTSWRNPPRTLHVANAISAEARRRSVAVHALRPRPDAPPGTVRCALLPDVQAEREWIADQLHARYRRAQSDGTAPPTAAVLVRRNADAAPIAEALRARGIPVEVVGLAGLLSIPEVADVVAMLRLVADPTAGAAAMRVLTGPRWRLGARDVAALWQRALDFGAGVGGGAASSPESIAIAAGPDADTACLADAISDPGPAGPYSAAGYQRIATLAGELSALRAHLGHSLPDLVAEVRRALGVDCEARAAATGDAGWAGTEHLDAFADVVAGYAERTSATDASATASVAGLLAFLDVAESVENGLSPAPLAVARERVQVLTVHSAKGLEWEVVAVAYLSGGIFPSTASRSTWLTDAAELPPLLRGDRAAAGVSGIPVLDTSDVTNRKQLSDKISEHRRQLEQRRIDEERRLLYVAITRAEDTLLVSGHHWGSTGIKPRGPSEFLCELKEVIDRSVAAGDPCGEVDHWAPAPADGERNPLRDRCCPSSLAGRSAGRAARRRRTRGGAGDPGDVGRRGRVGPRRRRLVGRRRCVAGRAGTGCGTAGARPARPGVGQRSGGAGPRPGGRGGAVAAPAPRPPRPACVVGQRLSRMGPAVLRRRAVVRPGRLAGRGGRRGRRYAGIGRTAGGVRRIPLGRPHSHCRRGAVRDADRRYRGARAHRRGVRRPRRRGHGGGLEDWRAAARTRSDATRGRPARRLSPGVGRLVWAPGIIGAHRFLLRACGHHGRSRRTADSRRAGRAVRRLHLSRAGRVRWS